MIARLRSWADGQSREELITDDERAEIRALVVGCGQRPTTNAGESE